MRRRCARRVRWVSLALLALLIVTPLAQIVMRGVFNVPMSGAEELARYFLICLTFLAASYVTREGGQIRMEEFQALLPPRPRWCAAARHRARRHRDVRASCSSPASSRSRNNLNNQTATLEMPFWLFMAPLAVGSLLLVVETAGDVRAHAGAAGVPKRSRRC